MPKKKRLRNGMHYRVLYTKVLTELKVARRHADAVTVRAARATELEREAQIMRRDIHSLKHQLRRRPRINEAEYEGRSAESWAREAKAIREILHDHHLNGWCSAQADVNRLVGLLQKDHRYRKTDNWRVELGADGYAWTCAICKSTYPAPLDYEWAIKPCPHPGAPATLQ